MKEYYKKINQRYPIINSLVISIVISMIILTFDHIGFNIIDVISKMDIFCWIISISCIIIILLILFSLHILDLIRAKWITAWDNFLLIITLTCVIYGIQVFVLEKVIGNKLSFVGIILVISLSWSIIRCTKNKDMQISIQNHDSNVIDLKKVYTAPIENNEKRAILFEEKAVDYDILNREHITNQLYDEITSCKSTQPFVIGLTGSWGSGKTTILNNLKNKFINNESSENFILISSENFNPWIYNNTEAMLFGMLDVVLKHMGYNYSHTRVKRIFDNIQITIGNSEKTKNILSWFSLLKIKELDQIDILRDEINTSLEANNKRLIFFIDNIERAEADNIINLFKLVSTIFNFNRTIFVLSYDKARISDIFKDTLKIDPSYIEKIVQQEIYITKISSEYFDEFGKKCMTNLLISYGVSETKISKIYLDIFKYVSSCIHDLRTFKRYLNTVLPAVYCSEHLLCLPDLLAMESIRFINPSLYKEIDINRRYYIDIDNIDYSIAEASCATLNDPKPQDKKQKYKSKLLTQYGHSTILFLNKIFWERENDYDLDIHPTNEIFLNAYFSFYLRGNVVAEVKRFVSDINRTTTVDEISLLLDNEVSEIITNQGVGYLDEWVNQFQFSPKIIHPENFCNVLIAVFMHISKFTYNQQDILVGHFTSTLISSLDDNDLETFLNWIKDKYQYLHKLYLLTTKFQNEQIKLSNTSIDLTNTLHEKIDNVWQFMCSYIIDNSVNVYSKKLYMKDNIFSLHKYLNSKNHYSTFVNYIMNIINKETIYKAILDTVNISNAASSSACYYYIDDSKFQQIFGGFTDMKTVELWVSKTSPRNESEKLLASIYERKNQSIANPVETTDELLFFKED